MKITPTRIEDSFLKYLTDFQASLEQDVNISLDKGPQHILELACQEASLATIELITAKYKEHLFNAPWLKANE